MMLINIKSKISIFLSLLIFQIASAVNPVVDADFRSRIAAVDAPRYFEIFADSLSMSPDELECMKFLYAYMPLPDLTDYPGEYFLENVRSSLNAREQMAWGTSVPLREFLHFVLPIRVNNENLDGHRSIFFDELKGRIEGLSMKDAILEVNHWCHEKATYEPSSARTHSPLATVSSAIGRCGEESTFTVAALRSVGIPARQVYTPRWAHTDDNHAWVEAWADGQWYFLGACEPEPVLNMAWFNEPATRGMLMNTRTPGRYDGPEEQLLGTDMFTDINVTSNYAPVDTLTVKVLDENGRPLANSKVSFRLYNYGEFYPVATKMTDANGKASIVAGLGDILVWASKDGLFAFEKVSLTNTSDLTLTLDPSANHASPVLLDVIPPTSRSAGVVVDDALVLENNRRKTVEDSIRNAYVATFVDRSRGNRTVIDAFLNGLNPEERQRGEALLASLPDKDLTDITLEVLNDAMLVPPSDSPLYNDFVLSPRIEVEFLEPFRERFLNSFETETITRFVADPSAWAKWVADSVVVDNSWQPASIRMNPSSVLNYRHTDGPSRDVFFVAGARAMGIPSRIDEVTLKPQYFSSGRWVDMSSQPSVVSPTGSLILISDPESLVADPNYYVHFTISRIIDGETVLLNFPEDATLSNTFSQPVALEAGEYILTSGQRLSDGSVLATIQPFTIEENRTKSLPLPLRHNTDQIMVIGSFNSESLYHDILANHDKSVLSTTGRGYFVIGLVSALDEPSNHALRDIAGKASELEEIGVPMLILFPSKEEALSCELTRNLPSNVTLGVAPDGFLDSLSLTSTESSNVLPVFFVADTFNRVVFFHRGYTINLGQQFVDILKRL